MKDLRPERERARESERGAADSPAARHIEVHSEIRAKTGFSDGPQGSDGQVVIVLSSSSNL
jgi:hypothetical protein